MKSLCSSYKTMFFNWDKWSSVRNKPRRQLDEDCLGLYFSPKSIPLLKNEELHERPVFETVLLQYLYSYLNFTAVLEHRYVNTVTGGIAASSYPFDLLPAMRLDAYRIYCDEAYHALASADVIDQISTKTDIAPVGLGPHPFFDYIERLLEGCEKRYVHIVQNLLVVVTETLISSTLKEVHKDESVVKLVQEVISDHAYDEAIHHKYFEAYFNRIWPQLSFQEKEFVSPLLADFISGFLAPNFLWIAEVIKSLGFSRSKFESFVELAYPDEELIVATRSASRSTREIFRKMGVFDCQIAQDAFGARGLL